MKIPKILIDVKDKYILMYEFNKEESSDFILVYNLKTFTVASGFRLDIELPEQKVLKRTELNDYRDDTINGVINLSGLMWEELYQIAYTRFIEHHIITDANGKVEKYVLEDLKTQFKIKVEDPASYNILIDIIDKNYTSAINNRAIVSQVGNIKKLLNSDLQFSVNKSVISTMSSVLDMYTAMLEHNEIIINESNVKLFEDDNTSISLPVFAEQLRILLTLEMDAIMSIETEDGEDERILTSIINILMSVHSYAFNILVTAIIGNVEQG